MEVKKIETTALSLQPQTCCGGGNGKGLDFTTEK